jgi:hypothetical protein
MVASAPAQALSIWNGTLDDFNNGPVTVGDKTFTYVNSTFLSFLDEIEIVGEGTNYTLFYSFEPTSFSGSTFTFDYDVQSINSIIGVGLDSDTSTGAKTLTTGFNGTTLVSLNGGEIESPLAPATSVEVRNSYVRTGGGRISSFSNSFEQVPEPLTILGTGLALGFGGLFKSKSSKKQSAEV